MIILRNFTKSDALLLQQKEYSDLSLEEIEILIDEWSQKQVRDRYFEMFAVVWEDELVGMISLYQHSTEVISIGPEIFKAYRRKRKGIQDRFSADPNR